MKIVLNGLLVISLFAALVIPAFAGDASDLTMKEEILKLQKIVLDLQNRIQQLEEERAKTVTETSRPPPTRETGIPKRGPSPKRTPSA